jgi:hypothetical protein
MAIEEYEGVVWTCSHFPQVDVFEHVLRMRTFMAYTASSLVLQCAYHG